MVEGVRHERTLATRPTKLSSQLPITLGGLTVARLEITRSLDDFLQLYAASLQRFLLVSLTLILLLVAGLFAYSSWLSWRVSQLSRWTRSLVDDRGRVNTDFPASRAADEIGELSRAYADLTERLKKHTDYLQGLAGRLSHEIRTPLTIIGSSLENLESAGDAGQQRIYIDRARQGLERLRTLLRRMSEMATLEAGIDSTSRQNFDPDRLLTELATSYRQSFPNHRIAFSSDTSGVPVRLNGSPDLLAQLVDKLMENALSFAPRGATIIRTAAAPLPPFTNGSRPRRGRAATS